MKLVVGLGNPGEKYKNTRHNLGFVVVDKLGKKVKGQGESWKFEKKFKAELLDFTLFASPLTLVKPQTYMNNSGLAVKMLTAYYNIHTTDLIIIHDDLDLPLGKIKVRLGGSGAGHHGVESIINTLGTDQFIRVRLGIGNEKSHSGEHKRISFSAENFVTEEFLTKDKSEVKSMIKQALKAIEIIFGQGLEAAQRQFN